MKSTAVLMKDNVVTILENIDHTEFEKLKKQKDQTCFIFSGQAIDWDYGY